MERARSLHHYTWMVFPLVATTSGSSVFLRGFSWNGKALKPTFEVDFTQEKLGRAHHMKLGSKALCAGS